MKTMIKTMMIKWKKRRYNKVKSSNLFRIQMTVRIKMTKINRNKRNDLEE